MLITGGCCHKYNFQTQQMINASASLKANIEWTVINEGGTGTQAKIDLYNDPKWADGYDVVVHNECFANTADEEYIRKITKAHHEGANAVVIHCAMHSYRAAKIDDWREFLGVTSRRHDHQSRYPVKVIAGDHPIMEGFPKDYITPKDELYIVEKVWPNTKVLATSVSERSKEEQAVFWTNQYGKARVFGTTYGHSNATFSDKTFLATLIRGIQWSAGRTDDSEPAAIDSTVSEGFRPIFDGKTLNGWRAMPGKNIGDFSVKDGVLVCKGSESKLVYLIYAGNEQLDNFEVKMKYRMATEGNSGVEIRSHIDKSGKRPLEGYHADFGHVGIGPQVLGAWDFHFASREEYDCRRGRNIVIAENGDVEVGQVEDGLAKEHINKHGWNDLHIIADGNHMSFSINGKTASEFTDNKPERLKSGMMGLQIHDAGMVVEFKDIQLKMLK